MRSIFNNLTRGFFSKVLFCTFMVFLFQSSYANAGFLEDWLRGFVIVVACNPENAPVHSGEQETNLLYDETGPCIVTVCNAGYDDNDGNNTCEETVVGFYSPADDKQRYSCGSGNPEHSRWVGVGHEGQVACEWACSGGYDDHEGRGFCEETAVGFYSPADDKQRYSCGNAPAWAAWAGTGKGSEEACDLACADNYRESADSGNGLLICDANDRSCSPENAPLHSGAQRWDASLDEGKGAWVDVCEVNVCNVGYDDHEGRGFCEETAVGFYSPADDKQRYSCGELPENGHWKGIGRESLSACRWKCLGGFDDHDRSGTCEVTTAGYYSPEGKRERYSCGEAPANAIWIGEGHGKKKSCQWSCQDNYIKDGGACFSNELSCSSESIAVGAQRYVEGVGYEEQCIATHCNAGYHLVEDAPNGGFCISNERSCSPENAPLHSGVQRWEAFELSHLVVTGNLNLDSGRQDGTANDSLMSEDASGAWSDCEVNACNAGYDDNDENNICELTAVGFYSPAGDKQRYSCGDLPVHASWIEIEEGRVSQEGCQWSCPIGYRRSASADGVSHCEELVGICAPHYNYEHRKKGFKTLQAIAQSVGITINDVSDLESQCGALQERVESIESLDLSGRGLSDVKPLRDVVNVRNLNLSHNQITNIRVLGRLKNLQNLNLEGNPLQESNKGIAVLHQSALTHLNIIGAVSSMPSHFVLPQLEHLETDQVFWLSSKYQNLSSISLSSSDLVKVDDSIDLSALNGLPKLTHLRIHRTHIHDPRELFHSNVRLNHLTHLEISQNENFIQGDNIISPDKMDSFFENVEMSNMQDESEMIAHVMQQVLSEVGPVKAQLPALAYMKGYENPLGDNFLPIFFVHQCPSIGDFVFSGEGFNENLWVSCNHDIMMQNRCLMQQGMILFNDRRGRSERIGTGVAGLSK